MQKESQTYKIAPADRLASVSEYYFSKKLKEVAQMKGCYQPRYRKPRYASLKGNHRNIVQQCS